MSYIQVTYRRELDLHWYYVSLFGKNIALCYSWWPNSVVTIDLIYTLDWLLVTVVYIKSIIVVTLAKTAKAIPQCTNIIASSTTSQCSVKSSGGAVYGVEYFKGITLI